MLPNAARPKPARTAAMLVAATLLAAAHAWPREPSAPERRSRLAAARRQAQDQLAQIVERVRAAPDSDERTREEARAAGFGLVASGRFAEAERLFAALSEKWPQDGLALYGRALALFNLRRVAEAEPLARAAVEKSLARAAGAGAGPGESSRRASDALVLLGVIQAVRGEEAAALSSVRRAVELAPGNFDAQFALGRALYGAGDPSGAASAFRAAAALRPADARARFFLASALERAGDYEAALAAYRALVAAAPASAEGHLGLGALLVKLGGARTDEGVAALLRAVELDPAGYEARVTLGRALVRLNRHGEAVEHLRRAAALAPDNPEPHFQLAVALRRLGRNEEAAAASAVVKRINESRRKPAPRPKD